MFAMRALMSTSGESRDGGPAGGLPGPACGGDRHPDCGVAPAMARAATHPACGWFVPGPFIVISGPGTEYPWTGNIVAGVT
jgi:hypothetical protein